MCPLGQLSVTAEQPEPGVFSIPFGLNSPSLANALVILFDADPDIPPGTSYVVTDVGKALKLYDINVEEPGMVSLTVNSSNCFKLTT